MIELPIGVPNREERWHLDAVLHLRPVDADKQDRLAPLQGDVGWRRLLRRRALGLHTLGGECRCDDDCGGRGRPGEQRAPARPLRLFFIGVHFRPPRGTTAYPPSPTWDDRGP